MTVAIEHEGGQFVTPAAIEPAAGGRYELSVMETRNVEFTAGTAVERRRPDALYVVPDFDHLPAWAVREADSVLTWLGLGRTVPLPTRKTYIVAFCPPLPLRYCAKLDGKWSIGAVAANEDRINLFGDWPTKPIQGVVEISGGPAPRGTLLFPGRFDVGSIGHFLDRGYVQEGLGVQLEATESSSALAAAEWLTAFHAEYGIAYLKWDAEGHARGAWAPGRIEITRDVAVCDSMKGTVEIWRTVKGTGVTEAGPAPTSAKMIRNARSSSNVLTLPGLAPGTYGLAYNLTCSKAGRRRSHFSNTAVVVVPEDGDVGRVRLGSP